VLKSIKLSVRRSMQDPAQLFAGDVTDGDSTPVPFTLKGFSTLRAFLCQHIARCLRLSASQVELCLLSSVSWVLLQGGQPIIPAESASAVDIKYYRPPSDVATEFVSSRWEHLLHVLSYIGGEAADSAATQLALAAALQIS
jgi:hypothetical protein